MMSLRLTNDLKWIVPLIIIVVLVATGCSGAATTPTQTPVPTSPPESAVTPTAVSAPSPEPAVTPNSAPDSAQEAESSDEEEHDHEGDEHVLFEDDFKDTESGWPGTLVFDNYYIGYHEPEWYHVEVHAQNDNALTVLPEQSFDDFTLEAEALCGGTPLGSRGRFPLWIGHTPGGQPILRLHCIPSHPDLVRAQELSLRPGSP